MRSTIAILLFFILFGACAQAQSDSQQSLLTKAAASYSKGKYTEAVSLYETAAKRFGSDEKLYYNLGNAYYKSNRMAPAILSYERALRLNPGDSDARFNLDMCNARIVDQINPVGTFLLVRWFRSIGTHFSSNGWAICSILCFVLLMLCVSAYFLARLRWLKKIGFFGAILFLMLSVLGFVYSAQASERINHPNEAILFNLSVTVKSSPDQSGTDLFVIHEGCKMVVRSVLGDWTEIELKDGNVGWLPSKDIQLI
jgi:tetratricopeptide (TPR) repeat protein